MVWKKFSEQFPNKEEILFFDGKNIVIAFVGDNKTISTSGYYCNDENCRWIYDDCGCDLIINNNCFWMPIPNQPERLSEETSEKRGCDSLNTIEI